MTPLCHLIAWAAISGLSSAEQIGENMALGQSYSLWPAPNYPHCTDPDDLVQLTDGLSTSDYFWTQRGTVGWTQPSYARITVDLGRIEPIGGVAFTTAAGVAGVTWPAEIRILVSDDDQSYRDVGDLVALDHARQGPWPEQYAIRRVMTGDLATRGRYVQFVAIALAGASYMFVDEVEVFRGEAEWVDRDPGGELVESVQAVFEQGRVRRALRIRYRKDADSVQQLIKQSPLDAATGEKLVQRLADIRRQLDVDTEVTNSDLRAVLPIGAAHAQLFQVQAELWKRAGRPGFWAHVPHPWDPLELISLPPAGFASTIEVHTMRGEHRAAAVNLYNATQRTMQARIHVSGLPDSPLPDYLTAHEVAWTDTAQSEPIAAALPEASRGQGAWTVSIPPGLVRQVWLTFHVTEQPADQYRGRLVIEADGAESLTIPLHLSVWPFDFPRQTTLRLGGWSYTDGGGRYGVTPRNIEAFVNHLQSHFVNAPWATAGVMMQFTFDPQDPSRIALDTGQFDEWTSRWPNASRYHVFLSVAHYSGAMVTSLGGAAIDSPEFSSRVGSWISAWVRHLGSRGIRPDQLGLLIHDEPHEGSDIRPLLAWARAIRAAEPDVIIWEDPTYRDPAAAPAELFEVCHVLCPNRPMWLDEGPSFAEFYGGQQRQGKTLELYSCSGPAKLLDPYSYYRLQAWHCRQIGATGSYFWAFGDTGGASSWCEYFARSGPYTPLFLDDHSVTAGKHMEAIRESVQDYEYFVMLGEAIERARRTGIDPALIANAEQLLTQAPDTVLAARDASQLRWHEPKDRTVADTVRVKLLQTMESLVRAGGK